MKKLRTYSSPSFRFIDVLTEHNHCDIHVISNRPAETVGGDGEADDADAPIFRPGIWDEDIEP